MTTKRSRFATSARAVTNRARRTGRDADDARAGLDDEDATAALLAANVDTMTGPTAAHRRPRSPVYRSVPQWSDSLRSIGDGAALGGSRSTQRAASFSP